MIRPGKANLAARVAMLVSFALFLKASSQPMFSLEGFGEFSLESLSDWGAGFLTKAAWLGIIACFVLPIRMGFLIAGCLLGGGAMLGLTLGKDAMDLASMDAEMSSSMDLIELQAGGKKMVVSFVLLILTCLISAFITDKKIPGRRADGDGKNAESEVPI